MPEVSKLYVPYFPFNFTSHISKIIALQRIIRFTYHLMRISTGFVKKMRTKIRLITAVDKTIQRKCAIKVQLFELHF